MQRFLPPVFAAVLLAGCGYIGDVQPPLANVPAAIEGLTATQRGARLVVQFALPARTTENRPIQPPLALDLRIGPAGEPFNAEEWAAGARLIPDGKVANGIARYEVPLAEWTGREVVAAARTAGANGKPSVWSNYAIVEVVPPPEKPRDVAATATPQGVHLTWRARGGAFRVFRREGGPTDFAPVATVPQPEWTDATAEFGKRYAYRVESIVKLAREQEAESDPSDAVEITPQDVFPPSPPQGLRAAAAPNSIELVWDANQEPFVAGYRVYRAAPGAQFEKIGDAGLIPSYSDRGVERGKTYRYQVAAVSKAGVESPASGVAEASLP
ncbi:MAG: hypothetical protein LAQ30_14660 [Acidobacteriia bacterium]|nr:hypothetical protein [Terriglobia bacterium]